MQGLRLRAVQTVVFIGLLIGIPSNAQATVTVTPETVTVAGVRGSVETRNLALRSTASVTNLELVSTDLERADNAAVFPATQISPPTDGLNIAEHTVVQATVTFNFQGVRSGDYSGILFVQYREGSATLPVIIKVKHRPWWALLLLIAGVGLGYTLRLYQSEGFDRDEVLVQVGR